MRDGAALLRLPRFLFLFFFLCGFFYHDALHAEALSAKDYRSTIGYYSSLGWWEEALKVSTARLQAADVGRNDVRIHATLLWELGRGKNKSREAVQEFLLGQASKWLEKEEWRSIWGEWQRYIVHKETVQLMSLITFDLVQQKCERLPKHFESIPATDKHLQPVVSLWLRVYQVCGELKELSTNVLREEVILDPTHPELSEWIKENGGWDAFRELLQNHWGEENLWLVFS